MVAIPVDVLREIMGHVRRADLVTLCRVNKTFCSCSQDILYREIVYRDKRVIPILAESTDLARRVRSFQAISDQPGLKTALRNMSSLRSLELKDVDASILDGCTFALDSFDCPFPNSESFNRFLNSQTSLTNLTIWGGGDYEPFPPLDEKCLPNLTRVRSTPSWLSILVPGRPVKEVDMDPPLRTHSIDWSFFKLSTTPIEKFHVDYDMIFPGSGSLLVPFPSLVHLVVSACYMDWPVRVLLCLSIEQVNTELVNCHRYWTLTKIS
jgi:F-box domain